MVSRNFCLKVLLSCLLVSGVFSASNLIAQSASDPLSNTPAVVEPVAPIDPSAPAVPAAPSDGQIIPHSDAPPTWFSSFLDMVSAIPKVGNALALLINWMGALAALLTAISSVLLALKKTLLKMGKTIPYADKVVYWIELIYPYVAWLSMYNVQKPQKP